MIRVIGRREVFDILAMFLLVQFAGLLLVSTLQNTSTISIVRSQIVSPNSVILSYTLDAILVIVVLVLLLNRHRRQLILIHDKAAHRRKEKEHMHHIHLEDNIVYGTLEAVVVVATSFFFFIAVFDLIIPQQFAPDIFFLSIGAALFLIAAKDLDHKIRNLVTMVSSIGVGFLLGLYFNFEIALIALAVVSVYDYLSVFVTKSMIKLAKAISNKDMALMISSSHLESVQAEKFPAEEVSEYQRYLHQIHEDEDPEYSHILKIGRLPVISQLQLGEGDLGLPLMAVIAAYITYPGYLIALSVVFGGAVGLLAAIRILIKYKHPLPAIPPLFAFISIFSGIALFITGNITPYNSALLVVIGFAIISFGMVLRYVQHKERTQAENRQSRKDLGFLSRIP
ncbi:MAG: presenilin family intramembrane aspartyl protease [Candidatus Micrarchaeales archaeon]